MATNSQERIIVDNQNPESVCPDGKTFEECETAKLLFETNQDFRTPANRRTADGGYNTLIYAAVVCEACKYICAISLEMKNGKPTTSAKLICDSPE